MTARKRTDHEAEIALMQAEIDRLHRFALAAAERIAAASEVLGRLAERDMASISTDARGSRTIQFTGHDRRRRTVRLGRVPLKDAEQVRYRIELLNAARTSGQALDQDTAGWLTRIGDRLHAKLAKVGLVQHRQPGLLGLFLDSYIETRVGKAPRTIINLKTAVRRLTEYFGREAELREITASSADGFCAALHERYAEATAARTITRAKEFFVAAVRAKIIADNPFAHVKPGSMVNADRNVNVSRQDTAKVLDACPDAEWRLIIALCRFGGLRCPSEVHVIEWPDVLWEQSRFIVRSPKTGTRVVPIFPELRPYLDACFGEAADGTVHVIAKHRGDNLRTQIIRIIERAGLVPWTRPFQNLRASRQNELTDEFPEHVVCSWMGNSQAIARRHYLQPDDSHFKRAAKSAAPALQKALQSVAVPDSQVSSSTTETGTDDDVRRRVTTCDDIRENAYYPDQGSNNSRIPQETIEKQIDALRKALHSPQLLRETVRAALDGDME